MTNENFVLNGKQQSCLHIKLLPKLFKIIREISLDEFTCSKAGG